jgi:mono/diheme cytochrome c family protein
VVGAHVYRGGALPDLQGRLVVADWSAGFTPAAGQLLVADPSGAAPWPLEPLLQLDAYVLSLGHDAQGELYVLTNQVVGIGETTGRVFQLVPAEEATAELPTPPREPEAPPAEPAEPAELGDATGWYTAAQATAGGRAFAQHCAACHDTGMGGAGPFPPITGTSFFNRWEGRSGLDLYRYVHTTMPLGEGGSLSEETYLDIMAHWLRRHAYPSGQQPLEDPEQLESLELRRP